MGNRRHRGGGLIVLMSAPATSYTISGTVYEADGSTPVSGATIALGALTATSAANGTYTISDVPAGTSGSMTCTKTNYVWTAITVNAMTGNLANQNYTTASYNYVFTTMSDGALPAAITATTWAVASGKATNTPNLGSELLTDPSLEANYTAGKCDTLTAGGSPTVAESADAHAGSKAQEYTGTANNDSLAFASIGSLTGKWLQISGWGKRTAGTSLKTRIQRGQNQFPGGFEQPRPWKDAAYTQKITVGKAYAATLSLYATTNGTTPFATVIVDDFSVKEITLANMYATRSWISANATTRIYIDMGSSYNGTVGIVARLDSAATPANYIIVGIDVHADGNGTETAYISMAKVVVGTLTVLVAPTNLSALPVNGDYIELVSNGDDFSMYYNGVQKGTTQTVTGMTGTLFGFFGAGGGLVNRFLLGAVA